MKTAMNNFKMMVVTLTGVFTLLFNTVTFASNGNGNDNGKAELHFVGNFENQPMFRLVLSNDSNADYIVTVKESNGDVLFVEKLSGSNISRVYKLDTESKASFSGTTFSVTNKSTKETTVYKISAVDDVVIAKL